MDSDQLHELLTQYDQNFRLFFDNAPLGILVTDSDGVIKLLNIRAAKMFGYERDELLGETIESLIPVGLRGKHILHRANFYDNPHTREMGIGFEVVGQRKNNERFPVEVGLSVIQHENSIRVISYVSDITKRDRAEKELKDSEHRFKLLLESTPDAILLINSDGRIIHTNKTVEEMFGYKNEELVDQFLEVLIPGGNQIKHVQDRLKNAAKLHTREMGSDPDIYAIRKDSSTFPVEINLNSIEVKNDQMFFAIVRDTSDSKLAEAALARVTNHLNAAQMQAQIGSWEWYPDNNEVWWSDGLFALLGLSQSDTTPSLDNFFELIYPEDRSAVMQNFERALSSPKEYAVDDNSFLQEFRIVCPDGSIRWVNSSASNYHVDETERIVIQGYLQDITEQKNTEDDLRKFSRAVEQSASSVTITNTGGNIEYVNPAFSYLSGYSAEEIIGENPRILNSGQTPPEEYSKMWQTIIEGGEWQGEFHNRKHTEEELRQKNAYLAALNETTLSIIGRLELEDLLQSLITRAGQLLQAPHGFIYLVDSERNELEIKVAVGAMDDFIGFRVKPGEGLGGKVWQKGEPIMFDDYQSWNGRTPQSVPEEIGAVAGVPLRSGSQITGVLGLAYDYGSSKTFGESEFEILTRFGELASISIDNARLYSDAMDARAAAEKANASKSIFLSNVSHELRTPLTAIFGFARIVQKRLQERIFPLISSENGKTQHTVSQVEKSLDIILSESQRLTAMINNVLDLEKIEAGKIDWNMQPIDLKEVITSASTTMDPLYIEKGRSLVIDFQTDLPEVEGDRDKLHQVMLNLYSNALKFSDKGIVICRTCTTDDEILVSIIDQGIGISPSDLPFVFDQFRQFGDTLTEKPTGSGLGLAICRDIIEHHGGRIWAESELGKGSKVSFALPRTS
jgi:PAS domain S-box-containing protein